MKRLYMQESERERGRERAAHDLDWEQLQTNQGNSGAQFEVKKKIPIQIVATFPFKPKQGGSYSVVLATY